MEVFDGESAAPAVGGTVGALPGGVGAWGRAGLEEEQGGGGPS
jgi:hypothetical protein